MIKNPKGTMMWKTFLTKCGVVLVGLCLFLTVDMASQGRLCGTRTLLSANTGLVRHERRVAFFKISEKIEETWVSREISARGLAGIKSDWRLVRIDVPLVWICQASQASRINWQINNTGRFLSWAKPNDEVFLDLKNQFVDACLKQNLEEMRLVSDKLAERAIATDPEGD